MPATREQWDTDSAMCGSAGGTDAYFQSRFAFDPDRSGAWRMICGYLQRFIPPEGRVLDLGAGYCSFVNHVRAAEKHALDVFPGFVQFAQAEVTTHVRKCDDLSIFADGYFDVVFASNLFEHLQRSTLDDTLSEIRRVLKRAGYLIVVQPNIRYCYREYFDDYTHVQAFSHVSLTDLLAARGFRIESVEPRFLPLSFKSRFPKWPWLVHLYLNLPVRPWAKQMLVVAATTDAMPVEGV